jgi:tetratricopeptide (TPR) repeat protein
MDTALSSGAEAAIRLWDQFGEANHAIPLFEAGRWLLAGGKTTDVVRVLEAAAERSPRCGPAYETLGDAYHGSGQNQAAAGAYERAVYLYRHHTSSTNPKGLERTIEELSRRIEELRRPA